MKNVFLILFTALLSFKTIAQPDQRVITTGVPFMLIAGDARSSGMGDIGVSSAPDAFSQQWNPAKYAFAKDKQGIGATYTPYLKTAKNEYKWFAKCLWFHSVKIRGFFVRNNEY